MGKFLRLGGAAALCAAFTFLGVGVAGATSTAPLSCNGIYVRTTLGSIDVPSGSVCQLNTVTVNGSITVEGQLYASTLDVSGSVTSLGGEVVQVDSSTIAGDFKVQNLANGPVNQDSYSIEVNSIGGNLVVTGNTSPTGDGLVSTNTVNGSEVDAFNSVSGDLAIVAETVSGSMLVYKNTGAGDKEVDANTVSNYLICLANAPPFEAHGNSAGHIVGPC